MIIVQNCLTVPVKMMFLVSGYEERESAEPQYNKIEFTFPPEHKGEINTNGLTPGRFAHNEIRVQINYFNDCVLCIFRVKRDSKIEIRENFIVISHKEEGTTKIPNVVNFQKMKSCLGFQG
uniref:Uncharacterized protein n=1 Tax=Paramoeba aestuarina TaxID=180227 RepID=A0A7S4PE35_9EUKA|mmetsp:Transcript_4688/g.7022  ORF Transcript_4688/g.7022 Transcript_4688/m.7022 type:complete len:121 (+) Transcript_4688:100-462(+)